MLKGVKRIKNFGVLLVAIISGMVIYAWIFVAVNFVSPDVIQVWEALVTLCLYFFLLIFAYIFDKFISKK